MGLKLVSAPLRSAMLGETACVAVKIGYADTKEPETGRREVARADGRMVGVGEMD